MKKIHEAFVSLVKYPVFVYKNTFGSTSLVNYVFDDMIHDFKNIDDADYELTLVGVCTDICVISNALLLKAYYPEMKIVVDASCCAGSDRLRHQEALDIMRSCQIKVINDHGLNVGLL